MASVPDGKGRLDVKAASKQGRVQHSPDDLLSHAESLMAQFNYEAAFKFIQRALKPDQTNPRALEMKALCLLERGQSKDAKQCLLGAIDACPTLGASKFMYLGQLCDGKEAVVCYERGLELLTEEAHHAREAGDEFEAAALHEQISTGFCALAEVYLTELCQEDEAQEKCLQCMKQALVFDEGNVQAMQTLASIHLSMSQQDSGREWLLKSMAPWMPAVAAMSTPADLREGEEEAAAAQSVDLGSIPPYEFRINTAKLLVELGMFEPAADVLDCLLVEDDGVMAVWYLQGWSLFLQGRDPETSARSLVRGRHLFLGNGCDQGDVLAHMEELLADPVLAPLVPQAEAELAELRESGLLSGGAVADSESMDAS